jgi:lantibiotic modifying enzyme
VRFSIQLKQHIAIWLCAILLVLSFAASAHNARHHHDGANTNHCTLCFHKHQFNKTVNSTEFIFAVQKQQFEILTVDIPYFSAFTRVVYHSRAPPVFL